MQTIVARGISPLVLAAALAAATAAPVGAQQPPATQPSITPYRPPVIALVQPLEGGSVPADKPFVVFRFVPGEPGDPIDVASFAITVEGNDRTSSFQVTATDAWGPIADQPTAAVGAADTPKPRAIAARICSARGACASVVASVPLSTSPAVASPQPQPTSSREGWLDLLLRAARRLLIP